MTDPCPLEFVTFAAQLADAGIERCHANRPVLVVQPGLMSNLMSMR